MGKFLILALTITTSKAAPFYGLVAHPNGAVVPADEPAVAAARADHLAAKGVVAHAAYAPVVHAAVPAVAHAGYAGPLNLNTHLVAHPNGAVVPADEPAVVAARADHLASKGAIAPVAVAAVPAVPALVAARADHLAAKGVVAHAAVGPVAHPALVAHPNGAVVPVDEPAVAAARAHHLKALSYGH